MNKKLYFLLLLMFAIPRLAFSQDPINLDEYKVIDHSRFVITYEAMMTNDSLKPTEHNYDRLVLMIGDSISRCYSYHLHRFDSAYTSRCVHKGKDSYQGIRKFIGENGGIMITSMYKYYESKRMTVLHRMPVDKVPVYLYEEPLDLMDWKMSFETKEILGYQCFKAECDFRGRHWTAWFTMQIPVHDGPWKFGGLPGLILQVEELRGHFAFRCIGIETQQKPILWYEEDYHKYQRCTRADVVKQAEDYHADYYAYMRRVLPKATFQRPVRDASGKVVGFEDVPQDYVKKIVYNPIELE